MGAAAQRIDSHHEVTGTAQADSSGSAASSGQSLGCMKANESLKLDPDLRERPDLTERYSVEVLHTTKGFLKGHWGEFRAAAFYRQLPGAPENADGPSDDVRTLRHILIKALDIARYAERDGEVVEVDDLGEGSYSTVYGVGSVAAKVISDRERPWVHKAAVENAVEADRLDLGPRIYGHGTVEQHLGGSVKGTVIFMERLDPLGDSPLSEADIRALLSNVQRSAQSGFHNDLKLPNVLRRAHQPVIIDFDLRTMWSVKVAVTTSCIEHSFQELLEPLGESLTSSFREYYDLFALSLTVRDGPLYQAVLRRLSELWVVLESPLLQQLRSTIPEDKLREIPFEVLVRVPLHGITVHLLDLRGNHFAHVAAEARSSQTSEHLAACAHLPQLFRSNGVYWPDEEE